MERSTGSGHSNAPSTEQRGSSHSTGSGRRSLALSNHISHHGISRRTMSIHRYQGRALPTSLTGSSSHTDDTANRMEQGTIRRRIRESIDDSHNSYSTAVSVYDDEDDDSTNSQDAANFPSAETQIRAQQQPNSRNVTDHESQQYQDISLNDNDNNSLRKSTDHEQDNITSSEEKIGYVELQIASIPPSVLEANKQDLEDLFRDIYNEMSGMCLDPMQRVMIEAVLQEWETDWGLYSNMTDSSWQNMTVQEYDEAVAQSVTTTYWEAQVDCNGCPDQEPLFLPRDDTGLHSPPLSNSNSRRFMSVQDRRSLQEFPLEQFFLLFAANFGYNMQPVLLGDTANIQIVLNGTTEQQDIRPVRVVGGTTRPVKPDGTADRDDVVTKHGEEELEEAYLIVQANEGRIVTPFVSNDLSDIEACFETSFQGEDSNVDVVVEVSDFCELVIETANNIGADTEAFVDCIQNPTSLECQEILPGLIQQTTLSFGIDITARDTPVNPVAPTPFADSPTSSPDLGGPYSSTVSTTSHSPATAPPADPGTQPDPSLGVLTVNLQRPISAGTSSPTILGSPTPVGSFAQASVTLSAPQAAAQAIQEPFPTPAPTDESSQTPSPGPTFSQTFGPTVQPTNNPSPAPTNSYTFEATANPTPAPTFAPSLAPTFAPTIMHTDQPSSTPTPAPTFATISSAVDRADNPTPAPTFAPSKNPTDQPTENPTPAPTFATDGPTFEPTENPTLAPTFAPTDKPTVEPTDNPTPAPTDNPTPVPTFAPTTSPPPYLPTFPPIELISVSPSQLPSRLASDSPSSSPTSCSGTLVETRSTYYVFFGSDISALNNDTLIAAFVNGFANLPHPCSTILNSITVENWLQMTQTVLFGINSTQAAGTNLLDLMVDAPAFLDGFNGALSESTTATAFGVDTVTSSPSGSPTVRPSVSFVPSISPTTATPTESTAPSTHPSKGPTELQQ
ncbi:Membrane [Seminavis robusta]|uniref:Membrane n=1 Tax=Seminavis robusta TaxID=568900 RepID=A0A9N8H0Y8_9STRA|nr:Membrane [Seminavis robusta]|eukprot:Sro8_g006580.1 Membrane (958) ;mRNA; f:69172-72762